MDIRVSFRGRPEPNMLFFFFLPIMLFGNAQIMLKITSKFCKRVYITLIPISQHIRLRPISEGDIIEIYPLQKLTSH